MTSSSSASYELQDAPPDWINIAGWTIRGRHGPIGTQPELEALSSNLGGRTNPLPTMLFPHNRLVLESMGGIRVEISAECLLQSVKPSRPALTVPPSAHPHWQQYHKQILDYDWTFEPQRLFQSCGGKRLVSQDKIPLERLKQPDPILFFDELVLYEDELGDHGISRVTVKVRVMDWAWYVLVRWWLRVDGQLVRVKELRLFCDFSTATVILGEEREREAPWAEVEGECLTNVDAMAALLPSTSHTHFQLVPQ